MLKSNKGFIRILEVFLALTILFIVLDKAYILAPPRYGDPENTYTLQRYAKDISFSLCNNEYFRDYFINDSLPSQITNFNWAVPGNFDYHIYLYSNNSGDERLDDLTNDTGNSPGDKVMATSSCIISGYMQPKIYEYNPSSCNYNGANCLTEISSSNDIDVNVVANNNFTVGFSVIVIPRKVDLLLEATHIISGNTEILKYNGSDYINIGNYSFSTFLDENHTFDLNNELPDGNSQYNVTIKPDVVADYDYAKLTVTEIVGNQSIYAPRKIVVGVWNK